jgi:hypothetical protein
MIALKMTNIVNLKFKCRIIEITQIYWKLNKMVAIKKVKFLCHFSQQISFVVNHNKISYKLKDTWHIEFEKCIGNFPIYWNLK